MPKPYDTGIPGDERDNLICSFSLGEIDEKKSEEGCDIHIAASEYFNGSSKGSENMLVFEKHVAPSELDRKVLRHKTRMECIRN